MREVIETWRQWKDDALEALHFLPKPPTLKFEIEFCFYFKKHFKEDTSKIFKQLPQSSDHSQLLKQIFNPLSASFALIWKPVNWFEVQISTDIILVCLQLSSNKLTSVKYTNLIFLFKIWSSCLPFGLLSWLHIQHVYKLRNYKL